jgi:hypothetical protein
MNKSSHTSKIVRPISGAGALAAALLCTTVHAEYRCATPQQLSTAEIRACELARQDTPDALIHFVNRTKGIYNLYVNDYVSSVDADRWEVAKRKAAPDSPPVAKTPGDTKAVSRSD